MRGVTRAGTGACRCGMVGWHSARVRLARNLRGAPCDQPLPDPLNMSILTGKGTRFIVQSVSAGKSTRFIVQSVIVGLAGAFVLLYLFPGLYSLQDGTAGRRGEQGVVSYSEAVAEVAPAVVNVYATHIERRSVHPLFHDPLFRRFFGPPVPTERRNSNLGSGVIMDSRGYLLTNAHVINNADEIRITLYDGRQSHAQVVGVDRDTDLAVLKTDLDDLHVAPYSDANQVRVGDVVLAIGNPYDLGHTVTQGVISATRRNRVGITTSENFIQTDAAINPGNSGGALVSARGKLIGINAAIISSSGGSQGIGLAIPVELALDVMQQLIEYGRVIRGWIGIKAQSLPQDIIDATGLDQGAILIVAVLRGSPADRAGIVPGDIMTAINGMPLYNAEHVNNMISRTEPGAVINAEILRGWETRAIDIQVSAPPAPRQ